MSSKKQTAQKVYIVFVALDFKNFDHYFMSPQIYYHTKEEAEKRMQSLIATKKYQAVQLKVQSLWIVTPPKIK